jgi:translation initiation factor IF-2
MANDTETRKGAGESGARNNPRSGNAARSGGTPRNNNSGGGAPRNSGGGAQRANTGGENTNARANQRGEGGNARANQRGGNARNNQRGGNARGGASTTFDDREGMSNRGGNRGGGNRGASQGRGGHQGRGGQAAASRLAVQQRPPARPRGPIELPSVMTVRELSEATGIGAAEILKALLKGGVLATINMQIDYETAALILADLGIETTEQTADQYAGIVESVEEALAAEDPANLRPRPPVVTIMGHVDHGKTKLLDAIRSTRVAEGEAGGITQHIGAYQVDVHGRKITFLDTPGHEAFTAMRARGAQATDIVVLVVAADDGVMPQTQEAISHVKAANVPMIVAINKIDLPTANPDRIKQQLAQNDVLVEDYGGDIPCVEVSARQRINIDGLLEMILLVADLRELKANPNTSAVGTIVEAEKDKNRGVVVTALIQNGTLRIEDTVLVGSVTGKIKAMFNDSGKKLRFAEPSTPVEILGLEDVPQAGDLLQVVDDIALAREVALQRQRQQRMDTMAANSRGVSLDDLFNKIQEGQVKELNVILKADVQGSIGAIEHQLNQLNSTQSEVQIKIIHKGTGAITDSDVNLAVASNGLIIGFNTRPNPGARRSAEQQGIDIRFYNIIYQLTDDLKKAMVGMLAPEYKEHIEGFAEVRKIFRLPTREVVAGLYVTDGKIVRNLNVRVLRNGAVIHDGKISSLKRLKDDVREVTAGYECGLVVEGFPDVQEGDNMEFYRKERVERLA